MRRIANRKSYWRPDQVRVLWLDAVAYGTLEGTRTAVLEQAKLARRESVGWLLRYDDTLTVIARDYDAPDEDEDEPRVGDVMVIPSGWVLGVFRGKRPVSRDSATAPQKPQEAPEPTGEPHG